MQKIKQSRHNLDLNTHKCHEFVKTSIRAIPGNSLTLMVLCDPVKLGIPCRRVLLDVRAAALVLQVNEELASH